MRGRTTPSSIAWVGVGTCSIAIHVVILLLSAQFFYEGSVRASPVVVFVGLAVAAGAVFLALPWLIWRTRARRFPLLLMLVVGAVLRLCMLPSTPILEDDFYRYLWDGAVLSHGINPYRYAPAASGDNPALGELERQSGLVAARINHPGLRTIYPPVAQAAFALSYKVRPWSLYAWRGLLFACDIATLTLLLMLLRAADRSPLWAAIYWWNPLVVKELFNSAHMDALLLPLLLAAVLLSVRGRRIAAAGALGLAAGVKLWPVLLLPVVLRPLVGEPRRLLAALALFGVIALAMGLPMVVGGLDRGAGLTAYATSWEMNDALFMTLAWLLDQGLRVAPFELSGDAAARWLVAAALVGLSLFVNRRAAVSAEQMCARCLVVTASLFLLSPAQYPWYYVWLVPFLAVCPRNSLLVLTALLPLYYLRFYFDARDRVAIFDYGIVWFEYLPVLALLSWEWARARAGTPRIGAVQHAR